MRYALLVTLALLAFTLAACESIRRGATDPELVGRVDQLTREVAAMADRMARGEEVNPAEVAAILERMETLRREVAAAQDSPSLLEQAGVFLGALLTAFAARGGWRMGAALLASRVGAGGEGERRPP